MLSFGTIITAVRSKMNLIRNFVTIVVLLGILTYTFGNDALSTCGEEQLVDLFAKWRKGDDTPPIPLPSLDSIKLDSYEGEYSGFGIKIAYATGEMDLIGVSNFTVNELEASADDLLEASGSIRFPLLSLISDNYSLKGRAYVFYSLKGSGFMNVTFENVNLKFNISLGPKTATNSIQVDNIRLNYTVDAVHVYLADSSWPLNKVLNADGMSIIESYHSTLVDAATEGLRSTINNNLAKVTPEHIANGFINHCNCNLKF